MEERIQNLKRKLNETRLRAAASGSEDVKSTLLAVARDFEVELRAQEARLANDKKLAESE